MAAASRHSILAITTIVILTRSLINGQLDVIICNASLWVGRTYLYQCNILYVANDIVVNFMHLNGSGPSSNTAPNPVTTQDRSIVYHLGPNPSAINTSSQLANPIPGSARLENRLVAIGSGSEFSAVVASDPLTNQVRGSATSNNEVAMVQPRLGSLTINAGRQEIDTTAPVTDFTISEPDPDKEYQALNATTSSEIDLNYWRRDLIEEILKWTAKRGCPNEEAILTMIQFLPGEETPKNSLDADQRRYGRRCFLQRESVSESFPIFRRPETEQFDPLKCSVHFNVHLEDDDDLSTIFDLESVADSQAPSWIG